MNTKFLKLVDGSPKEIPASDIFSGKKVAVCGVPGALTPTCSEQVCSNILVEPCSDLFEMAGMLMIFLFFLNSTPLTFMQHLPGFIENVDNFKRKVGCWQIP